MRASGESQIRVAVTLAIDPISASVSRGARAALAGRLSRAQINEIRSHRRSLTARVLATQSARRRAAAAPLRAAFQDTAKDLTAVALAVKELGGHVVGVQYAGPTLISVVPARAIPTLERRWDVASISPAPRQEPMGGLASETAAVGAPTWWSAGYLGGTGTSDVSSTSLAVMDDKIQEDQPLFQGVSFERPLNSIAGTLCGQASAGCEHGTEVAGMAIATGNSVCPGLCTGDTGSERGIAYGVPRVLDADMAAMPDSDVCLYDGSLWAFGFAQPPVGDCGHPLPGATHPAYIQTDSHGGYTSADDSQYEQNLDKFISTFGAVKTEPSGNDGLDGTGSGHITDSCIAYDVICVGGATSGDPATVSDDAIADFSSSGPSPLGRKKPDIVAVAAGSGSTNMTVVEQRYTYWNRLERGDTGTSFASPQVAGAAALLYGSGLTDPLIVKAILLDSTTLGRATAASEMGTQTSWQPDWGWGELNLDSAYQQRGNFAADGVSAEAVRFYRANVDAGDRATLVWNRRVIGAPVATAVPQALTLSNLDLYEYADAAQTLRASSTSEIDNVEQVRGVGSESVVYKVKDQSSTVDGLSEEPFALAATNPLTPLSSPKPTVILEVSRPSARQGQDVTVTQTVQNASDDLAGGSATATLSLPPDVSVSSGGSTTWSPGGGTLPPGTTATHQWTVHGSADGLLHLSASAEDSAYGETFSSAGNATLQVDSTPPSPAISCSHTGSTDPLIAVGWGATDSSALSGYDVEVSADGTPYVGWFTGTNQTAATFPGTGGHSYAFRVRVTDALGNVSAFTTCDATSVGFAPLQPASPLPPPTKLLPVAPKLRLTRLHLRHGRLFVSGTLARGATGRVTITYSPRGHRRVRARVRVRRGRYRVTLRVRGPRGLLRVEYPGDRSFAAQHLSRRVK